MSVNASIHACLDCTAQLRIAAGDRQRRAFSYILRSLSLISAAVKELRKTALTPDALA